MHEANLGQRLLDTLMEQAKTHGAARVTAVWLEISALDHTDAESLRFNFAALARGTPAQDAGLFIHTRPARAWCIHCDEETVIAAHDAPCPRCGERMLLPLDNAGWRITELRLEP